MKTVCLENGSRSLVAKALPDYGGLVSELVFDGIPILHFDASMIGVSNILAGGVPILFPFLSWTEGDRYCWQGRHYTMPFHGLVKAGQFGVAEQRDDRATLYIEASEVNMKENYPFDFRLDVTYALREGAADFVASVTNRSGEGMPHYFGWHPWFADGDRAGVRIRTMMGKYFEYSDKVVRDVARTPDLHKKADYVFFEKYGNETVVESESDGYRVRMETDDSFDVLLVNTAQENAIVVEPWLGLPNSINTGEYVKFVPPGERRDYRMTMHFERIGDLGGNG